MQYGYHCTTFVFMQLHLGSTSVCRIQSGKKGLGLG